MRISDATRPGLDLDLDVCSILHEEIERLPERQRLSVVLVDLEGLNYEQAAGHLHWTVPVLCYRLAKARKRLRDRLSRRGVTAMSLVVVMASSRTTATAALPASWIRGAVAVATGGPATAAVAALTQTILRGMLVSQLKIVSAAVLVAAGFIFSGVIALGEARPDSPGTAPNATAAAKGPPAARDVTRIEPTPGAMIEVRGRVVDPEGRPVVGATLQSVYFGANQDVKSAPRSSGSDGRFIIQVPPRRHVLNSLLVLANRDGMPPWIVASAPGFGLGWASAFRKPGTSSELTVRLVEDGPPIEGRVIDLEGRPVAGARVKVDRLWYARDGKLSDWLVQAEDRGADGPWQGLYPLPTTTEITIAAITGPDGRFRLAGMGRDRIAVILVSGPAIATAELYVQTGDGPAVTTVRQGPGRSMALERTIYHARRFEFATAPTRPIEGTIRDKDTGRPLAGIKLQGMVFEETAISGLPASRRPPMPRATIASPACPAGLPIGCPSSRAKASPIPGPSCGRRPIRSAWSPSGSISRSKRGVLVRGRVTDKATGKPVSGYVESYTFNDNPHVREFPGYFNSNSPLARFENDGRYEVVTLPGRGIIACGSDTAATKGASAPRRSRDMMPWALTRSRPCARSASTTSWPRSTSTPRPSRPQWTSRSTPAAR